MALNKDETKQVDVLCSGVDFSNGSRVASIRNINTATAQGQNPTSKNDCQ